MDLGKLIGVLRRSDEAAKRTDPFSILRAATGGTQFHIRKQKELENALATAGVVRRSAYTLSYYPSSTEIGYHAIRIEVSIPGAHTYARRGYWMMGNQ